MTSTADSWVPFDEEAGVPWPLGEEAWARLEGAFTPANAGSVLNRALLELGLRRDLEPGSWLKRDGGHLYVNRRRLAAAVSCGAAGTVNPLAYGRLLLFQFRLEGFLARALAGAAAPHSDEEALVLSTALALAMMTLALRLPPHDGAALARWLADPVTAPSAAKAVLPRLHAIQLRRTELRGAWERYLGTETRGTEAQETVALAQDAPIMGLFHGQPVHGGRVSGTLIAVKDLPRSEERAAQLVAGVPRPRILFLRHARPEAVLFYPHVDAVAFGEGGALSHACVVAREQRLPAVTALGAPLWSRLHGGATPRTALLDGVAGTLEIPDTAQ